MKISILVPIYNVEKYIERCAISLFTQTDTVDVEYVFVNDCTPDNSIDILNSCIERYPQIKSQVKIITHTSNKGLAATRNTGLDNASGNYILLLDSDDTLSCDCVAYLKEQIERALTSPDIIVFGMQFVYPDGVLKLVGGNYVSSGKKYLYDVILRNCLVTVCGKMYSKKIFDEGNIRFIEGLNYGEDYATLPRLVYNSENIIDITDKVFYNYYQDNVTSYTKLNIGEKHIKNILLAIEILLNYFKVLPDNEYKMLENILFIRNKIFLLEYVSMEYINYTMALFPEYRHRMFPLPLKHRLVWHLSKLKSSIFLKIFLGISRFIKDKFHI